MPTVVICWDFDDEESIPVSEGEVADDLHISDHNSDTENKVEEDDEVWIWLIIKLIFWLRNLITVGKLPEEFIGNERKAPHSVIFKK